MLVICDYPIPSLNKFSGLGISYTNNNNFIVCYVSSRYCLTESQLIKRFTVNCGIIHTTNKYIFLFSFLCDVWGIDTRSSSHEQSVLYRNFIIIKCCTPYTNFCPSCSMSFVKNSYIECYPCFLRSL